MTAMWELRARYRGWNCKFAAYGATKRSVVHLTKSLQAELQMQDVKNVVVHNLSPGMVTTDLLMSGANTKQAKFFINVLAEPAEVVAEYLVPNIRSISGSTRPTYIRFLTENSIWRKEEPIRCKRLSSSQTLDIRLSCQVMSQLLSFDIWSVCYFCMDTGVTGGSLKWYCPFYD
ncbi:hypothetical protein ACFE04_002712 [Oxalis oulophora]